MNSPERRQGDQYLVSEAEKETFRREGWVHLRGVLSEAELAAIDEVYGRFLRREIKVPGKDFCDMAGDYGRDPSDFSIVNVMLPRKYFPEWQGNLYERRAASIAAQLAGPGMKLDYDQLIAKGPGKRDAVFHWHQDLAYWFETDDARTATCWLAVDPSTRANGCMRFVKGSHRESTLRPHHPLHGDRDQSHTLLTTVDEARDTVIDAEIARGDITVHNERICHGSGGNFSSGWRRAYIVAFRSESTVAEERRRGFTHSHNDAPEVKDSVAALTPKPKS